MTKEQYKEHLKDIIQMVIVAEESILTDAFIAKLRSKEITPDEYLSLIADEILDHTSEEHYNKMEE